ncbi:MAG: sulfite exporter TauE/SafE family protein [Acidimicrobiia bacterium]|nr:sulfite exporter TauE/SafE family protein [Acidimicrobiia bacterium]
MVLSEMLLLIAAAAGSFAISASAGLGGSLLLVPSLMVILGPKEGVVMAALLLAANNVAKVVAYRRTLPIRKSLIVVVPTMIGAYLGATLLARAPESWVVTAVVASLAASLVAEAVSGSTKRQVGAPLLAGAAGITSGFSGTSGPLKGVAVRGLGLDRRFTVGAATLASLAGDVTKTLTFAGEGLLGMRQLGLAAAMIPLMIGGTMLGYRFNGRLGDSGYTKWFWVVIGAYSLRLLGVLPS